MPSPARQLVALGETLVDHIGWRWLPGGAPFNVARHVAGLGMRVLPVGRVGADDASSAHIVAELRRFGSSEAGLQRDPALPTGRAHVAGPNRAERYRIEAPAAWDALDFDAAQRVMDCHAPDIVYFGTLSQRCPVARDAIRQLLDRTAAVRVLDINLRPGQDNRDRLAVAASRGVGEGQRR